MNPLVITAGVHGRGSLSRFQTFLFSLIVVWLISYFLIAESELTDLSPTVLILLGVSAARTVAAKVTSTEKKRISLVNWSWLIKQGWIRESIQPARRPPRISDLMRSGGEFDVSKFQMLAVSLVVAGAMVYMGLLAETLKDFAVPASLLGLLGVGQIVYVGGKAVGSTTVTELDVKLTALRKLEAAFVQAVSKAWMAAP